MRRFGFASQRVATEVAPGTLELKYGGQGFDAILSAVKALPHRTRSWDPERKCWMLRPDKESQDAIAKLLETHSFLVRKGFDPEKPTLAQAPVVELPEKIAASSAVDSTTTYAGSKSGMTPRGYQCAGVDYMIAAERCLVGDEPGLGKTAQSLIAAREANAFPLVVFCPATLKRKWAREAHDWLFRGAIVQILSGGRDRVHMNADVVVVNYDLLRVEGKGKERKAVGLAAELVRLKPAGMVCDESHLLKNAAARRTRAVLAVANGAGVKYRWLLSGTASVNHPLELASQFAILGRLAEFGGWRWFNEYYAEHTKARDLDQLNRWMRSVCLLRREKKQGLPGLPPKGTAVLPVDIENRDEYEEVRTSVKAWLAQHKGGDRFGMEGQLAHLRQIAAKGKLPAAYQWIGDFLEESGEPLVVFAWHTAIVHAIAGKFNAPKIYGATSQPERDRICTDFQAGKIPLVVCNIQAGGVGIDLFAASNVLFLELPWTPAEFDQATDRCHRQGQTKPVTAWVLLAENTIDEKIMALLERKRAITEMTNKGSAAIMLAELAEEV